jgi:hypothetical protein
VEGERLIVIRWRGDDNDDAASVPAPVLCRGEDHCGTRSAQFVNVTSDRYEKWRRGDVVATHATEFTPDNA